MRRALIFNLDVLMEDRGDYWAAFIESTGLTVYGDTEAAARVRVFHAMDSLKKYCDTKDDSIQESRAYLDAHGVPSSVTADAVQGGAAHGEIQDDGAGRLRYSVSMDFSAEAVASV